MPHFTPKQLNDVENMRFDQVSNDEDRENLEYISGKFDELIIAYENKHLLDMFLHEDLLI